MRGLLIAQGIEDMPLRRGFEEWLEEVRIWHGGGLQAALKTELLHLYSQYQLFAGQLRGVSNSYQEELTSDTTVAQQRVQLELLKGIGPKISRVLSAEAFAWREFRNTKQVGGMSGLKALQAIYRFLTRLDSGSKD